MCDTLRKQLTDMRNAKYPFIRRDKQVRARILGISEHGVSTEVIFDRAEPKMRFMSHDYFDNNYWEGVS